MTLPVSVWTAAGLLVVGLLQVAYTLLLTPVLFRRGGDRVSLNDKLDRRKRQDTVASVAFVLLTSVLSIWTIGDQLMSGPVTSDDFVKLEARVTKLENDSPPGSAQRMPDVEASLREVRSTIQGLATTKDLERTRKELEKTIEKIFNQLKGISRPQGG